jgi:glucose/arabinose dehydrogenase
MSIHRPSKLVWWSWFVPFFCVLTAVAAGQQKVPFRGTTPVAPQGIPPLPLPEKPVDYHTAEGQDIRVTVLVKGLSHPWSLAFLPDGSMLLTERPGRLRVIRNGTLDPQPVAGVPAVKAMGLSGLMDVVLHPKFAENHYVYLSYTKGLPDDKTTLALARGTWNGTALTDVRDVFVASTGTGGA